VDNSKTKVFADLGGTTRQIRRLVVPTNNQWSAFNPSIGHSDRHGYVCLVRSSNYYYAEHGGLGVTTGHTVRNQLWLGNLDLETKLQDPRRVTFLSDLKLSRGVEDARLFQRDGEWFFHAVLLETHQLQPRIALFSLDYDAAEATLLEVYNWPGLRSAEKNWAVPLHAASKHFDFVYDPTSVVTDRRVVQVSEPHPRTVGLRGGTGLLELSDGGYLAVGHRTEHRPYYGYDATSFTYRTGVTRLYTHCFVRYDDYGRVTGLSEDFVFDEHKIEFAAGLATDGADLLVSYGVDDLSSRLARVSLEAALSSVVPLH
jgi:hypothetical protein